MRPTKQLIRGLRETAQRLRDGTIDYGWMFQSRCNCGVLAQTLLNISESELEELISDACGSWSEEFVQEAFCRTTGLPLHKVAQALDAVGFEHGDYARLEFIDGAVFYKKREFVAAWMDAEADKLEARRAAGERPERGTT